MAVNQTEMPFLTTLLSTLTIKIKPNLGAEFMVPNATTLLVRKKENADKFMAVANHADHSGWSERLSGVSEAFIITVAEELCHFKQKQVSGLWYVLHYFKQYIYLACLAALAIAIGLFAAPAWGLALGGVAFAGLILFGQAFYDNHPMELHAKMFASHAGKMLPLLDKPYKTMAQFHHDIRELAHGRSVTLPKS